MTRLASTGPLSCLALLAACSGREPPRAADGGTATEALAHVRDVATSGEAMRGSVAEGFSPTDLDASFAASLAQEEPQPEGCAW